MEHRLTRWVAAALVAVLAATAHAGEVPAQGPVSRLEAAQLAAARNLRLVAARFARERAARLAEAARAPYVPVLELHSAYHDAPPTLFLDDAGNVVGRDERDRTLGYRGTVAWSAPTGTTLAVEATARQALTGIPVFGDAARLALIATQPLLEGAWRAGAAAALDEAEVERRIERERYRGALETLLAEVDEAYWSLAFAGADREIKTGSLARAQQQYEDTRENIRRGILAEGDIYIVEENLVIFRQQLAEAGERLVLAQRRLAALLQLDPDTPLTAADPLAQPGPELPEAAAAVDDGLRHHPDLAARALEVEKQRVRLAAEENRVLPRLDLSGRLALNGYGDLDRAWGDVGTAEHPEATLGLTFAIPLGLGPDRARAAAARLELQRLDAELERDRTRVRFEVRDRLTELQSLAERLTLAVRRVELAELKLQAETEKYEAGIATLADVVRFQRDIDTARIELSRLQRDLLTRHARLLAARGGLGPALGVELR